MIAAGRPRARTIPRRPLLSSLTTVLLMCGVFCGLDGRANGQTSEAKAAILASWESQRSAVVTANFRLRLYRYLEAPAVTLDRARFNQLVESMDLSAPAKSLESLRARLPAKAVGYWGTPVQVFVEGARLRNNIQSADAESNRAAEVHIFNAEEQVAISAANQQASVHAGSSGRHIIGVSDLRFLPRRTDELQLIQESNDLATLQGRGTEIAVQISSGFVHRYTSRTASHEDESNTVAREIIQLGPITYADGIVFPTVTVDAKYQQGVLMAFSIYLIEQAEFNLEIPAEVFIADAPASTQIVDYRENPSAPRQHVLRKDVVDVVDAADEIESSREGGGASGRSTTLVSSAAILTGVVLVLWGIRMFRGRKPTA